MFVDMAQCDVIPCSGRERAAADRGVAADHHLALAPEDGVRNREMAAEHRRDVRGELAFEFGDVLDDPAFERQIERVDCQTARFLALHQA